MCPISYKESLELFHKPRLEAIEHIHHRVPVFSLELPEEDKHTLVRMWEEYGWIRVVNLNSPSRLGNCQLVDRLLAYAPNAERAMTVDERTYYIDMAWLSTSKAGAIVIKDFRELVPTTAPKEALYRLVVDGAVIKTGIDTRRQYVLLKELRSERDNI